MTSAKQIGQTEISWQKKNEGRDSRGLELAAIATVRHQYVHSILLFGHRSRRKYLGHCIIQNQDGIKKWWQIFHSSNSYNWSNWMYVLHHTLSSEQWATGDVSGIFYLQTYTIRNVLLHHFIFVYVTSNLHSTISKNMSSVWISNEFESQKICHSCCHTFSVQFFNTDASSISKNWSKARN